MKKILKLAFSYIRYYKKQTLALFFGMVLSAAILTGIGSLFYSGRQAALENARQEYGDWHYALWCSEPWFEDFQKNPEGKGFQIETYGIKTIKKTAEEPFEMEFVSADSSYLKMMGRKLLEGKMPEVSSEIAMDRHALRNLDLPEELGCTIELDGQTFTLCGILTEMPEKLQEDRLEIFVSSTLDYGTEGDFLYLKFREKGEVYKQAAAFADTFGVKEDTIARNNGIAVYVGGEAPVKILEVLKAGIFEKGTGLPYIWGQLNSSGFLTENTILAVLGLFGGFILYSLFQVSVIKRISQYSIMQTLGITEGKVFQMLWAEQLFIFAAGYPLGSVLGNSVAALIYQKIGRVFIVQDQVLHTGVNIQEQALEYAASNLPDAGKFRTDFSVLAAGAVFFFLLLTLISLRLVRKMRRLTVRQMITGETERIPRHRKIYSLSMENLTGILTKKFMFSRKGAFAGILFSLSVGSVIFLGAFFVMENTKINNELTFKADDGLGSDIQVYEASDQLKDIIPREKAAALEKVNGIGEIHPVRYLLGEIPLTEGKLKWTSFFEEVAEDEANPPDPELMEKYNGRILQTGEKDYLLKVNIYGYDDKMLKELQNYLIEGDIDPDQMREENSVIFKTISDGQGNTDGIDLHQGDSIFLKTPKDTGNSGEILKFLSDESLYNTGEFQIAAVTNRPLAKVETYIGDSGSMEVDIIMTNEQMEENFGVTGYQTISISLKEEADAETAAKEIRDVVSDVPKCMVKDYTEQINSQNLYLAQKMIFFYGIALVLFLVSLLHIMNSMQYLVAARKHEFGILRAMGITDTGFMKMLAKEGLRYGIYSSLAMTIMYFFVQKMLYYFMLHVYLYLHPQGMISPAPYAAMVILNLVICVSAVLVSGRSILKQQIIEEIRE